MENPSLFLLILAAQINKMFNLFKKKETSIKIVDKIWMNESAKIQSIIKDLAKNKETVFIFWFDDTLERVKNILPEKDSSQYSLLNTREAASIHLPVGKLIFAEHYPLPQKEKELFEKLKLAEAEVWSAMDEPLFKEFGSEKIVQMMKQFGMKEDQVIEHNMISKAIHNAQEKIEAKVTLDQMANSQEEWLRKNWKSS